ncbi:MAG: hypothetical protein EBZ51_07210 [Synechococcaceae bacterium WB9_2_112]|nr:hypothetical protein [Synechococcaceae bacterium WB9_2_112]
MRLLVLVTQEQKFCHELARPLRSAVVMDQQRSTGDPRVKATLGVAVDFSATRQQSFHCFMQLHRWCCEVLRAWVFRDWPLVGVPLLSFGWVAPVSSGSRF